MSNGDLIHVVAHEEISAGRARLGRILIRGSFLVFVLILAAQALQAFGSWDLGFTNFRPAAIAWSCCAKIADCDCTPTAAPWLAA